jgi:hypothetical protein
MHFAKLQFVVSNPSKYRFHTFPIRIPSPIFNDYYELFRKNAANVRSLMVLGADNDDIQKLSTLHSLDSLALPLCRADNFGPLTELKRLLDLRIANPNLEQFREDELLRNFVSLRSLTLYHVVDLRAALELPGLEAAVSPRERGLKSVVLEAAEWNPKTRIDWPEKLELLRELSVLGERFRLSYGPGQGAGIIVGRHEGDAPVVCSILLKDIVKRSGFYERRKVIQLDVTSRHIVADSQYAVVHDKTDISPLQAFPNLRYLTLEGDFYGFEELVAVPLESVYFTEMSPPPSSREVEAMSRHPTLRRVTKVIESATERVLYERLE